MQRLERKCRCVRRSFSVQPSKPSLSVALNSRTLVSSAGACTPNDPRRGCSHHISRGDYENIGSSQGRAQPQTRQLRAPTSSDKPLVRSEDLRPMKSSIICTPSRVACGHDRLYCVYTTKISVAIAHCHAAPSSFDRHVVHYPARRARVQAGLATRACHQRSGWRRPGCARCNATGRQAGSYRRFVLWLWQSRRRRFKVLRRDEGVAGIPRQGRRRLHGIVRYHGCSPRAGRLIVLCNANCSWERLRVKGGADDVSDRLPLMKDQSYRA